MAFQSRSVFSEVTLFPKKRHSFGHSGSTFFVFFPRRRFETQETVPTGIVARLARGLARVGHSRPAKKPKRSSQCFRFSVSQPREASKRTDRTGVSRREASAGSSRARVRKRRRERPARVASRPRAARVPGGAPHERGDGSRDRFIIASSANDDGCVETRDARLFAGVSWCRMTTRVGVFRTRTRVRVRRVFVRWRLNFRDASFAVASASTLFDKRQKPKASSTSPASSFPAARAR